MRFAYAIQAIGFVVVGCALWYGLSRTTNPDELPVGREAPGQADRSTTTNGMALAITSTAFSEGAPIPSRYTCDGKNTSPPLRVTNVPSNTRSLVLIVEDPDVPTSIRSDGTWDHFVMYNIPPRSLDLAEGETPEGTAGLTTSRTRAYSGPCPPDREHRYFFRVYALDSLLDIAPGATKDVVTRAMEGKVVGAATLMGRYKRAP